VSLAKQFDEGSLAASSATISVLVARSVIRRCPQAGRLAEWRSDRSAVAGAVTVAEVLSDNGEMFSTFSILPILIYVPVIALLVIGIWVGILGIRALNKYLRTPTPETKQPH
jgi:hypothetical protein